MPRDVNLGEGYVEGVMVSTSAPGQHRGQYELHDGSTVLIRPQQMADLGRRPRGRGRGWGRGWGYGPVFYEPLYIEQISDRKPFILDESTDESDEEKKKAKNLKGLADAANDCISRMVAVAGAAAKEAVEGVRQGIFKSIDDVKAHIGRRVCEEFTAHGRTYILAMQEAMKSALAAAQPEVEKLLAQKRGVSDLGRCCGRGMGDIKSDVAAAIASRELDELMSGVRKVQDSLIEAINARPSTLKNYQTAAANYDAARESYSDGASDALDAAQKAKDAAVIGVQFFARQVQTLAEIQIVFGQVSAGLQAAGLRNETDAVDQTIRQVNRFVIETDNLFTQVPEYSDTKYAIISAFNRELSGNRVNPNDYANRGWFQSYMNAVEKVVPLPKGTGLSGLTGFRGMGGLGNPMAPALVALIVLVAGVVATVVAIKAINKMAEVFNSKAETARQLVLQRDQNWTSIEAQMRSQGASEAQIDAARAKWNAQTKAAVDQIPEAPSIGGSVGIVAGILLAAGVGLKAAGVL